MSKLNENQLTHGAWSDHIERDGLSCNAMEEMIVEGSDQQKLAEGWLFQAQVRGQAGINTFNVGSAVHEYQLMKSWMRRRGREIAASNRVRLSRGLPIPAESDCSMRDWDLEKFSAAQLVFGDLIK